jgi:hypothetical protein
MQKGNDVAGLTDRSDNRSTASLASDQSVVWTGLINCVVDGNGLRKSSSEAQTSTARSQQSITSGDGYIEFIVTEANKTRYCGLTRSASMIDAAAMDFAIKLTANGIAEIRESNDYASEVSYRSGDVFRIAIEGSEVKYYKNGSLIFTSLKIPSRPLFVAAILISSNSTVGKVIISTGHGKQAQH